MQPMVACEPHGQLEWNTMPMKFEKLPKETTKAFAAFKS